MSRLLIVIVGLLALTPHVALAQRRSSPIPIPSGHSTPAPGSRNPSGPRVGRVPFDTPLGRVNRHATVFALPFFWSWGAPAFYFDPRVSVLADGAPTGGVQLDVTPWRSQVYVDGMLMGRVDEFKGYYHPLEVAAGPHQIAIVDEGRQPLIFDVVVTPGRTIPYRATLNEAAR